MQRVLTFISSVTSLVRMVALTGQLAVILIDTIAVIPASGIPHAVRKRRHFCAVHRLTTAWLPQQQSRHLWQMA